MSNLEKRIDEDVCLTFKQYCEEQPWCKINRFSKKEFSVWDVSYTSADTKGNIVHVIGEIKYKDKYPSTNRDNWLLTVDKYEALEVVKADAIERDPSKEYVVQYINIYCDGKIWIWNTDLVKIKGKLPQKQNLPTTTYENLYQAKRKQIDVYYMNKKEAIIREDIKLITTIR